MDLTGYALVTGAGSGIGYATALGYAKDGVAGVAFADLNMSAATAAAEASKKVAKNPAYKTVVIEVDITDRASVDAMVAATLAAFGRLDYAANCAGVYISVLAEASQLPADEFTRIMKVNVTGTLYCMQAEVEAMKAQEPIKNPYNPRRGDSRGSIVVIASTTSWVAGPFGTAYTASKHAVNGLIKGFAIDHAPYDIRVNGVFPAWVDTPMLRNAAAAMPPEIQIVKRMKAMLPGGRIAEADEVADAVLFLSSPRASYINGGGITVDGAGCVWPANHHEMDQVTANLD